jgi:hypothetical protein
MENIASNIINGKETCRNHQACLTDAAFVSVKRKRKQHATTKSTMHSFSKYIFYSIPEAIKASA